MFSYAKPEQKQASKSTVQKKGSAEMPAYLNRTGIPDAMKTRFENLSGFSFDDVRVHYNSDKPAQLQALAYTQGNQVYVAPGQEKHLGHELGHVVQQKQGRVRATAHVGGAAINDDAALEREAEVFGANIWQTAPRELPELTMSDGSSDIVQGDWKDWGKLALKVATGIAAPTVLSLIPGASIVSSFLSGGIDVINSGKEAVKQVFTTKRKIPENSTMNVQEGTIEKYKLGDTGNAFREVQAGNVLNIPEDIDVTITKGTIRVTEAMANGLTEKESAVSYLNRTLSPTATALGGAFGMASSVGADAEWVSNASSMGYVTGNADTLYDNLSSDEVQQRIHNEGDLRDFARDYQG